MSTTATLSQLIPVRELSPGAVGAIRNAVITNVVKKASKDMKMSESDLVVRDVRPLGDLSMYSFATTTTTVEGWKFEATGQTVNTWIPACGSNTMADQRYVAIYGVRNTGLMRGIHATLSDVTTLNHTIPVMYMPITQIRVVVGGADKTIWDVRSLSAYGTEQTAFTPSAVIIPQNTLYRIYYQYATICPGTISTLQLIGVAVEPRGKLISP